MYGLKKLCVFGMSKGFSNIIIQGDQKNNMRHTVLYCNKYFIIAINTLLQYNTVCLKKLTFAVSKLKKKNRLLFDAKNKLIFNTVITK